MGPKNYIAGALSQVDRHLAAAKDLWFPRVAKRGRDAKFSERLKLIFPYRTLLITTSVYAVQDFTSDDEIL